jgi:8-oxo-dGTP pyrophosphatase MutT (NUDIX family)
MQMPRAISPSGPAAYTRPRDAATLVLLRRRGKTAEVLMGRRSDTLAFMPGMFVFPGGRMERSDMTAPRAGTLHEGDARRLVAGMGSRGSLRRAEALALSAIRETQEETGLFIGRNGQTPKTGATGSWAPFRDEGVLPDLAALRFIARAITPPGRVRRFDTRFFAADAGHAVNPDGLIANPAEELEEVRWVGIDDAHEIKAPDITKAILKIIERRLQDDPDLSQDVPVPFFRAEYRRFVHTLE